MGQEITATEVRILGSDGSIVRWSDDAAQLVAQVLNSFREAALAHNRPFPEPVVFHAGTVLRKVTVVKGNYFACGDEECISYDPSVHRNIARDNGEILLSDLLPREALKVDRIGVGDEGREFVFRVEVECIDPDKMEPKKPQLEVVKS